MVDQRLPSPENIAVDSQGNKNKEANGELWIAIEPPRWLESDIANYNLERSEGGTTTRPPSFRNSQFATILRRQRLRPPDNSGLKNYPTFPSRFIHLTNSFEFSGWGSVTRLKLSDEDYRVAKTRIEASKASKLLGQFTATAVVGNAILGGVFYTIPAVAAAAGVFSPISLFVATLTLFVWRPIMEELAAALPMSGAPYTYLLHVSSKTFALVGATLMLLDFTATAVVSSAAAAVYLSSEAHSLPFPTWVGTVIILVLFTIISLFGVRESTRVALAVLSIHLISMIILIISSSVHWRQTGLEQLKTNWKVGRMQTPSAGAVAKQIFYGICLGMLGLTGFECTSSYISLIKPGRFPQVLRNLHIPAIILNPVIMVLVLAVLPLDVVLGEANVLISLADVSGGRWLRILIVVDAIIVLCGGVLTGILSACQLLSELALHRVLPSVFLKLMPRSHSPYVSILFFLAFGFLLYASASLDLNTVSQMFSLVWLLVMGLFPISLLLLNFNRHRLKRGGKKTKLSVIFTAIVVVPVVLAGVVAYQPKTIGYFLAYFIGILLFFRATQDKVHFLLWVYWIYDQNPILHRWKATNSLDKKLITFMNNLKRQPVCIFVKTDEINILFHMVLYVRKNEETSYLKIVHICEEEKGIPSELEANAKILDEAFPEITIDLVLVYGRFDPLNVIALSHHLGIPPSLMFMNCPGENFEYSVAHLGTRIISL